MCRPWITWAARTRTRNIWLRRASSIRRPRPAADGRLPDRDTIWLYVLVGDRHDQDPHHHAAGGRQRRKRLGVVDHAGRVLPLSVSTPRHGISVSIVTGLCHGMRTPSAERTNGRLVRVRGGRSVAAHSAAGALPRLAAFSFLRGTTWSCARSATNERFRWPRWSAARRRSAVVELAIPHWRTRDPGI